MLQTNLDTLLFCSKLLCRKLLQVSEYGPWIVSVNAQKNTLVKIHENPLCNCFALYVNWLQLTTYTNDQYHAMLSQTLSYCLELNNDMTSGI
jgi:hypothetical protein